MWLFYLSFAISSCVFGKNIAFNRDIIKDYDKQSTQKLKVHLVPHTHDDAGWLKTVDQYYYGANNSIQHACVQCILDTTISALEANPARRFLYVETIFLYKWWRQQNKKTKEIVRKLVNEGRLEIANGGWVMHDEACAHYVAMVDQTTLGHQFIMKELGAHALPKVGWQIDPFGHSATQASLLSAAVGFTGLFFGRIDYQDRQKRIAESRMEMIWQASRSIPDLQVFAGAFHSGNYGAPEGFCFDTLCTDNPIMDDPDLEDYNVKAMVENFVKHCLNEANHTVGTNLMVVMGMDFQYENAHMNFKNLDKLIDYVNNDGRIELFYSTPSKYVEAKLQEMKAKNIVYEIKTDDFFPYADCPHCFWTGYFSSRPALKFQIRQASSYLQAARQLEALHQLSKIQGPGGELGGWQSQLSRLEQADALVQHHDGVSGTSKQHVAEDYSRQLSAGLSEAVKYVGDALADLSGIGKPVIQCQLLNESRCLFTEESSGNFTVIVYNPSSQIVNELIAIPINTEDADVHDGNGNKISSEVQAYESEAESGAIVRHTLFFVAEQILPLNMQTFSVQFKGEKPPQKLFIPDEDAKPNFELTNGIISLSFDGKTGCLLSTQRKYGDTDEISLQLKQGFFFYEAFDDKISPQSTVNRDSMYTHRELKERLETLHQQRDGAYIFRPKDAHASGEPIGNSGNCPQSFKVFNGSLVQEVHQFFAPWAKQIIRLKPGECFAEFEWEIGSIPVDDDVGKSVITRFSTNIKSGTSFFTDSNGREFQERTLDYRPTWALQQTEPVAGNYFPVTTAIFIRDATAQLSVLNDRSQGGSSLTSGEIELMVHRRGVVDDDRGVAEPLNETDAGMTHFPTWQRLGNGLVVKGKHYVFLSKPDDAMADVRLMMDRIFYPPVLGFSEVDTSQLRPGPVFLSTALPKNIAVMTLKYEGENKILLRLSHQFSVEEHPRFSKETTVNLSSLFAGFKIKAVQEISLTTVRKVNLDEANPNSSEQGADSALPNMRRLREVDNATTTKSQELDVTSFIIKPMEIKTFYIRFETSTPMQNVVLSSSLMK